MQLVIDWAAWVRSQREAVSTSERKLVAAIGVALAEHGTAKPFAQRLGISEAYLSDIGNGRRGISQEVIEKLCGLEEK